MERWDRLTTRPPPPSHIPSISITINYRRGQAPLPSHYPPTSKKQALRAAGVKFRILVTGPVVEAPATGFVRLNDTEFLLPNATITRGDLSRIATEFFLVSEKQEANQIYGATT